MITPHLDTAVDFLRQWKPAGPWLLAAFHNDRTRAGQAQEFDAESVDKLREWVARVQKDGFNVYFHVNSVRPGLAKKAAKTDVATVDWFHVDVDPEKGKDIGEEQKRILADLQRHGALPKPTLITFSGGGYQAFWKLADPVKVGGDLAAIEQAERYNQQIAGQLGGDNCHNADRIMRLPGTVNYPNDDKRKKGQTEILAEVIRADWDLVYPVSEFVQAPQRQDRGAIGGGANRPEVNVDSGNVRRIPPERLAEELAAYKIDDDNGVLGRIIHGDDPDAHPDPTKDRSRSGHFFGVACELVRHDVPDEIIFSILTDPNFGISEHALAQGRNRNRAALRAIQNAKEYKEHDCLGMMNAHYAAIEDVGGKFRIMCERFNPAAGRHEVSFQQKDGFLSFHANKFADVPITKDGKMVGMGEAPVGKWWLAHKKRREYRTVVFYPNHDFPDTLNLWRGFNVDAIPGDCSLFLDHVKDVLCGGNEEYYRYLVGWMANAVQNPHMPGQTAVVMRGGQGTGKGTFARHFGYLFGMHYKHIVNPDHITGQFNSVLRDASIVFADECFAAKDKKHAAALKALITEDKIQTEAKGLDSIETRNCTHVIMATNADWAVAADLDDRRFFVLNVSDQHKQDTAYFEAMERQMNAGGYEALMHMLLTHDLRGFNVRQCPKTEELRVQQDRTLSGTLPGFLLTKLEDGELSPYHTGWRGEVLKDEFEDWLQEYCDSKHHKKADVFKFLKGFLDDQNPTLRKKGEKFQWKSARGQDRISSGHFFAFPSLEKCRRLWDEKYGPREWTPPDHTEPDGYEAVQGEDDEHF